MKKSYYILGIVAIILLFAMEGRLKEEDFKIYSKSYRERKGMDKNTFAARVLGIKKTARSFLWMGHVVKTGGLLGGDPKEGIEALKTGSERITYLDPYFVRNYTFTGGILAFIKTYKDFEGAFGIIEKGMRYNPNDSMLKKYLAGTVAGKKGNSGELLKLFEEIVKESRDDLLMNTLAFSYEKIYEESGEKYYLEKSIYYWGKLLDSKDEKYQKRAKEKLLKYLEEKNKK
ncbi:hypothetical protein [uncultured Ilyobacter sp.]|uniref:hypothetical protein n=1 Tax=uncultured Ilyobacter sp. TaxID=544433 RepID=UPI0029C8192A|nr:hypothetical protein [uncultured Ilyobacter sp.]